MSTQQTTGEAPLKLVYNFDAPREMVFNAFSNAEALNEWWGPVELKNTVIKLDFKVGGIFHYRMEGPNGTNYGRFLFSEIHPHDLLAFTNAFADEHANIVRAPFDVTLPLEIYYRLVFTEQKGKTTITLTGEPVKASREEEEGFLSIRSGMDEGFGATFAKLAGYLQKIQSA